MDQLFLTINSWMTGSPAMAAAGCFLWGMVSVLFSPCHMASIPLIVAYVGGQEAVETGKRSAAYAVLFSLGLFITIAVIGTICALLGRMLGDIGEWWTVAVGAILIWVALDMLGIATCSMPGSHMSRFRLKGFAGAFILGLAYGVLSGSCTFGFIAPILAIITVQEQIVTGVMLILLFALGHCLPIVLAGSSTHLVRRMIDNSNWHRSGLLFRKLAGGLIGALGLYFVVRPFI